MHNEAIWITVWMHNPEQKDALGTIEIQLLGRGLLEVYQGWTDAASGGDLEEVY